MLITLKRVLLTGLFLACAPRFGAATPITWDFEGEIFFSGVSDLPVGTPVSIEWSFDDEQPNACPAGDPGGLYRGMSATVVLGDFTYTTSGFFVPGRLPSACTGAWPDRELRLPDWSGPLVLPSGTRLVPSSPFPPGLFWMEDSPGNSLPTAPPDEARLIVSNWFPPHGPVEIVEAEMHAVPEPGSLALVATGCVGACLRRRRSGRRANPSL
jgi:hypothetical protein